MLPSIIHQVNCTSVAGTRVTQRNARITGRKVSCTNRVNHHVYIAFLEASDPDALLGDVSYLVPQSRPRYVHTPSLLAAALNGHLPMCEGLLGKTKLI